MEQYISKSALVAEIKKHRTEWKFGRSAEAKYKKEECDDILSFLDTLEVKEVDFEKIWKEYFNYRGDVATVNVKHLAKHFFELGLKVNCPITASDRGMAEEIIVNLKRVEKDYRIDLTKQIEWLRNKTKKNR